MQNLYIKSLDISGRVLDLTTGRYISMSFDAFNIKKIVKKFPDTLDLENRQFKVKFYF